MSLFYLTPTIAINTLCYRVCKAKIATAAVKKIKFAISFGLQICQTMQIAGHDVEPGLFAFAFFLLWLRVGPESPDLWTEDSRLATCDLVDRD